MELTPIKEEEVKVYKSLGLIGLFEDEFATREEGFPDFNANPAYREIKTKSGLEIAFLVIDSLEYKVGSGYTGKKISKVFTVTPFESDIVGEFKRLFYSRENAESFINSIKDGEAFSSIVRRGNLSFEYL